MAVRVTDRGERIVAPAHHTNPSDPNMTTAWMHNRPAKNQNAKRKGWEFASEKDVTEHDGYEENGAIVKGDLILMKRPREMSERDYRERHSEIESQGRAIEDFERREGISDESGRPHDSRGRFISIPK